MPCRYRWLLCLAALLLTTLPLAAGNIDVSSQTTVGLNTGDVLFYTVADLNFVQDAGGLGVSQYPTAVEFSLMTAPLAGATLFTVDLESSDGTVWAALPAPVSFAPGSFQSSLYKGPVSVLSGTLYLSASASQQLFGGSAILAVHDDGAPLALGLAPYTIGQDLFVSLSGSGFSVGALQGSVVLDPPGPDPVPEPPAAWLLLAGGTLLVGVSAALNRASRKRIG